MQLSRVARPILRLLPLDMRRRLLYRHWHGRALPAAPTRFTEKIQWRIINDRRELIARGGDKLAMKAHVVSTDATVSIPETYWYGVDVDGVLDRTWPSAWVLKPANGSGMAHFGAGTLREAGVGDSLLRSWQAKLRRNDLGEWAYSTSRTGYLIEQMIPTTTGRSPHDLRFFVFDGRVRLIKRCSPSKNPEGPEGVLFYTPDWEPLVVREGIAPVAPAVPAPAQLERMTAVAERIGEDFDFIRVDLYDTGDDVWFGEITPYPNQGSLVFDDPAFDEWLGSLWTLPETGVDPEAVQEPATGAG